MNIVIVDDSMTVRITIEAFLEDLGVEESTIHSFENAHEAIAYIEEHKADVIISDMYMPEMDGFEFAEKIFELNERYRSIFFVVSGEENYEAYRKMKKIGVTKFIKKPLDFKKFTHYMLPLIRKLQLSGARV